MNHKPVNIEKLGDSILTPLEALTQLNKPPGLKRNVIVFQKTLPNHFKKTNNI